MEASSKPASKALTPSATLSELHVVWISAALGCDGDTINITGSENPSLEALLLGIVPNVPKILLHNQIIAAESADEFMAWMYKAAKGDLDPFVLVVEGSVPDEKNKSAGYWAALGEDPTTHQPILTTTWITQLAAKCVAAIGVGTCAAFGGIHSALGNPTGAMGLADFLGWNWKSTAGLPVVNIPGCPVQADNFMETLMYLLYQLTGQAPMIPLDGLGRPMWLFTATAHEQCPRSGYYEQYNYAETYGTPECIVKLGCWGIEAQCNVPQRGWINGVGGCPNVGGLCIGCTMPSFPDKFEPFMDQPPQAASALEKLKEYGEYIAKVRKVTLSGMNKVPDHRLTQITGASPVR